MERNLRKERIGVVVSNKMEKTIVVAVARKVKHPIYGKFVNKTTKFVAECLDETCKEGDTVRIMETRPAGIYRERSTRRLPSARCED